MITYNRTTDRKRLRYLLRRWQRTINALLALAVALAILLAFAPVAQAGTVRCRMPWQPVLMRTASGGVVWTCMYIPNWEVRP
jgi:hypothetical protein